MVRKITEGGVEIRYRVTQDRESWGDSRGKRDWGEREGGGEREGEREG